MVGNAIPGVLLVPTGGRQYKANEAIRFGIPTPLSELQDKQHPLEQDISIPQLRDIDQIGE